MMSKELVEAAKNGNIDRVRYCVKHLGTPVDCRHPPKEGPTALYWAACNGYGNLCDWLIRNKADPNVILPNSGSTPLHAAADRGHYNCVLSLICSGSQVNKQTTNNGDTPLHLAAYRNYTSVCRLLMEHGANMQIINKQDRTPLDEACLRSNSDVIQLLTKNLEKTAIVREKRLLGGTSKDCPYHSDDRIGIQPFDIDSEPIFSSIDQYQEPKHMFNMAHSSLSSENSQYASSSQDRLLNVTQQNVIMSKRIDELEKLVTTLSEDLAHKNTQISALLNENERLRRKLNTHENSNKKLELK